MKIVLPHFNLKTGWKHQITKAITYLKANNPTSFNISKDPCWNSGLGVFLEAEALVGELTQGPLNLSS